MTKSISVGAGVAVVLLGAACAVRPSPEARASAATNEQDQTVTAAGQPDTGANQLDPAKTGNTQTSAPLSGKQRKIEPSPWQPPAEVDPVPPGLGNDSPED